MNMEMGISDKTYLYNLIAKLCSHVTRTLTKNYLVRYSCISEEERQRVNTRIEKETPFVLGSKGKFCPIAEADIDEEYVKKLAGFSDLLKIADDKNCIMRFLQALDESLAEVLIEERKRLQNGRVTRGLNSNRKETGIAILPKCECVWARKSRESFSYRRIDNYLKHLMIIEDRVLEDVEDRHIFIPKGFFPNFDATSQMKIAATPLNAKSSFDIRYHRNDDLQVFSLDYHESAAARDNERVWEKIVQAGAEGAELIAFPEMLGNATMEYAICRKLKNLSEQEREQIPPMIVLPSYFSGTQNFSSILDRAGNVLARQFKQNPYVLKTRHGDFMENIDGSNEIYIFHYEGIGRFAVLICKDFLTTKHMERIMRGFMLTLIIVPAYSTGSYDFKMSFDLCAHDYCNVVWINSCAAMIPGKESNFAFIGYVRKRINRYQDESESMSEMKPCDGLLNGKCDGKCIYYDHFGTV
ncbi:carbon-nitrogen hydrolase family protein [Agathobacter ruminis]|uniref:CN hydrolase domain-containing protein n=1 Tax=Agathobacter ruminis TaxID=1712665 RepID=A0A2G3E0T0_9FIRM|nr:hypothetical protein [Agathobacter ruminis]MDC7300755.1 hypothetical protein [Agathobacter ruminis]PHU36897.1 hypothetical protein CSX02_10775 [Agathobacter ruminis]